MSDIHSLIPTHEYISVSWLVKTYIPPKSVVFVILFLTAIEPILVRDAKNVQVTILDTKNLNMILWFQVF